MKQRTKITCLVGAGLIFFGGVMMMIAWLLGADIRDAQVSFTHHETPHHSESYWNNLDKLSESGKISPDMVDNIQIDWIGGEVILKESSDGYITFSEEAIHETLTEETEGCYEFKNGTLSIYDSYQSINYNFPKKRLTLYLPADCGYSVSASTSSADVKIPALQLESLYVNTTSGDISCENTVSNGHITFDTTSGDIDFTGKTSANFTAETSSGEIEVTLNAAADEIYLDASSGDIELHHNGCNFLTAETTSGEINLTASSGHSVNMNAQTTSGEIYITDEFDSGYVNSSSGAVYIACGDFSMLQCETTSADVTVKLPKDVGGFGVYFETSSGTLHSVFPLTTNTYDSSYYSYQPNGASAVTHHDEHYSDYGHDYCDNDHDGDCDTCDDIDDHNDDYEEHHENHHEWYGHDYRDNDHDGDCDTCDDIDDHDDGEHHENHHEWYGHDYCDNDHDGDCDTCDDIDDHDDDHDEEHHGQYEYDPNYDYEESTTTETSAMPEITVSTSNGDLSLLYR